VSEHYFEFRDVSKSFDELNVLDRVSFFVDRGETAAILGRSGVGKSVTLKHIMGFLKPDSGRVIVAGKDVTDWDDERFEQIRHRVTMVFQSGALFDSLTVRENVAFPLESREPERDAIPIRVNALLEMLEVADVGDKLPAELSTGMKRAVAIARALAQDPEAILYDEPTTGLDPIIRNSILNLICHTYHQHGFTMVMISHDIPEIFQWSHYVVVLHGGKVVEAGPTAEVVRSVNPFVQQIIRGDITGPVHLM